MGQTTATLKALNGTKKAMDKLDNEFRVIEGKALMPGHYYRGIDGVIVKVVRRSPSGKTVYITTHTDDDMPFLQTKRVNVDDCGNEYICYKKSHYVVGSWNETDREAFRSYINANIGNPVAVI